MCYCIATFCYGKRYYKQTNRMIEAFDSLTDKPNIFIVTDCPEEILKKSFVFVENISKFNIKYKKYAVSYYDFDFSVKRFSVQFALDNGYEKIILSDADILPNINLFNYANVIQCFNKNTISGPVNFNLMNELQSHSMLGKRMLFYEKYFKTSFAKENMLVSEDCVQYFDIENSKFQTFLNTWDECIRIKDRYLLPNIPAGNIDEITFSALYNNINLNNNSDKSLNLLVAHHDIWYR